MKFQIGDEVEFINPSEHLNIKMFLIFGRITVHCFGAQESIGVRVPGLFTGIDLNGNLPTNSREGLWVDADKLRSSTKFEIGDEVEFIDIELGAAQRTLSNFHKMTVHYFKNTQIGIRIKGDTNGDDLDGNLPQGSQEGFWIESHQMRLIHRPPKAKYRTSMDGFNTCDNHWNTFELLR